MKHILVTGGAGFIGAITAFELLDKGYKVTVLDHLQKDKGETLNVLKNKGRDNFQQINCDIRDLKLLSEAIKGKNFDAVIHFAAYIEVGLSTKIPEQFYENNIVGSQYLFQVLIENSINNVIFSSSAAVYGTPKADKPLHEDDPKNPESPYATSKLIIEYLLESYCKFRGMNGISLRYFNPSGSLAGKLGERHQPETHLIPNMLRSVIDPNHKFVLMGTDYPTKDGTAIRDYIHVLDLADAHIAAVEYLFSHSGYDYFNVGTGNGTSILEVVNEAEKVIGKKISYTVSPRRAGDCAMLVADSSKIAKVMNWKAKYGLHEILSSAWDWEQQRPASDFEN